MREFGGKEHFPLKTHPLKRSIWGKLRKLTHAQFRSKGELKGGGDV